MLKKRFSAEVTPVEGERAVMARISTAALDRDKEVMLPQGMDAKDYEKNPVVFYMHDHYSLPVGKCTALTREGDAIVAKTVFAERPATYPANLEWLPDTLLSLYQQKVMNAFSIGFEPREVRPPTKKDIEAFGQDCQRVYSKWALTEYSAVTLPANQEAVSLAVSKCYKEYAEAVGVKMDEPETPPATPPAPVVKDNGNYRQANTTTTCKSCQHKKDDGQGGMHCTRHSMATDAAGVCDNHEPMMEPMAPKRFLYVIGSEAATPPGPDSVAKAVRDQISKRRGRIYILD